MITCKRPSPHLLVLARLQSDALERREAKRRSGDGGLRLCNIELNHLVRRDLWWERMYPLDCAKSEKATHERKRRKGRQEFDVRLTVPVLVTVTVAIIVSHAVKELALVLRSE